MGDDAMEQAIALGRLEGRMGALERQVNDAQRQGRDDIAAIYAKLDIILARINTGAGGLKAGLYLSHAAAAILAFGLTYLWPRR